MNDRLKKVLNKVDFELLEICDLIKPTLRGTKGAITRYLNYLDSEILDIEEMIQFQKNQPGTPLYLGEPAKPRLNDCIYERAQIALIYTNTISHLK